MVTEANVPHQCWWCLVYWLFHHDKEDEGHARLSQSLYSSHSHWLPLDNMGSSYNTACFLDWLIELFSFTNLDAPSPAHHKKRVHKLLNVLCYGIVHSEGQSQPPASSVSLLFTCCGELDIGTVKCTNRYQFHCIRIYMYVGELDRCGGSDSDLNY